MLLAGSEARVQPSQPCEPNQAKTVFLIVFVPGTQVREVSTDGRSSETDLDTSLVDGICAWSTCPPPPPNPGSEDGETQFYSKRGVLGWCCRATSVVGCWRAGAETAVGPTMGTERTNQSGNSLVVQ